MCFPRKWVSVLVRFRVKLALVFEADENEETPFQFSDSETEGFDQLVEELGMIVFLWKSVAIKLFVGTEEEDLISAEESDLFSEAVIPDEERQENEGNKSFQLAYVSD